MDGSDKVSHGLVYKFIVMESAHGEGIVDVMSVHVLGPHINYRFADGFWIGCREAVEAE